MANGDTTYSTNTSPINGLASKFSGIFNTLTAAPIFLVMVLLFLLGIIMPPRKRKYKPKKARGRRARRKRSKRTSTAGTVGPVHTKKHKRRKSQKTGKTRPLKPWMVKGSQAARDHMRRLRNMRKKVA